jgi:hypothetical protein
LSILYEIGMQARQNLSWEVDFLSICTKRQGRYHYLVKLAWCRFFLVNRYSRKSFCIECGQWKGCEHLPRGSKNCENKPIPCFEFVAAILYFRGFVIKHCCVLSLLTHVIGGSCLRF